MNRFFTLTILSFLITINAFAQNDASNSQPSTTSTALYSDENNIVIWVQEQDKIYFVTRQDSLDEFQVDSLDIKEFVEYGNAIKSVRTTSWNARNTYNACASNTHPYLFTSNGRPKSSLGRGLTSNCNSLYTPNFSHSVDVKSIPAEEFIGLNVIPNEDQLIFISPNYDKYLIVNIKGKVEFENDIKITKPKVYSFQGREMVMDENTKELYFITKTNFNFLIHKLNYTTGKMTLVEKTDGLWPNPQWSIRDGILTMMKDEESTSIDLSATK